MNHDYLCGEIGVLMIVFNGMYQNHQIHHHYIIFLSLMIRQQGFNMMD